jgi:hypothetical protein
VAIYIWKNHILAMVFVLVQEAANATVVAVGSARTGLEATTMGDGRRRRATAMGDGRRRAARAGLEGRWRRRAARGASDNDRRRDGTGREEARQRRWRPPLLEFLGGIDELPSNFELLHAGLTSHHLELGLLETPTTTRNSAWMGRRVEEDERAGQREVLAAVHASATPPSLPPPPAPSACESAAAAAALTCCRAREREKREMNSGRGYDMWVLRFLIK